MINSLRRHGGQRPHQSPRRTRRTWVIGVGGTGQEVCRRVVNHPNYYATPTAMTVLDDKLEHPELRPFFHPIAKRRAKVIQREILNGSSRYPRISQHVRCEHLPRIKQDSGAHQEGALGYFYTLCSAPFFHEPAHQALHRKLLDPALSEQCRAEGYDLEEDLLYIIVVRSTCGGMGGGSQSLPVGLAARAAREALGHDGYDTLEDDVRIVDVVTDYQPFMGRKGVHPKKLQTNTGVFLADLLRQAKLDPGEAAIEVEGQDGEIEHIPEGMRRLTYWLSGHRASSDEQFAGMVSLEAVHQMKADFVVQHLSGNLVSAIFDQYSNITSSATVRGQPAAISTFGLPSITFNVDWLQRFLTWSETERLLRHALHGQHQESSEGTARTPSSLFDLDEPIEEPDLAPNGNNGSDELDLDDVEAFPVEDPDSSGKEENGHGMEHRENSREREKSA